MSAHDNNFDIDEHIPSDDAREIPVTQPAAAVRATEIPDRFQRRQDRIDEHLREALEHKDARTSILGTVTADVAGIELQVGEALREAIGTGRLDPEDLARNREGIEMLLKLGKQVVQLTQLYRKLLKDGEPPPENETQSEKMTN